MAKTNDSTRAAKNLSNNSLKAPSSNAHLREHQVNNHDLLKANPHLKLGTSKTGLSLTQEKTGDVTSNSPSTTGSGGDGGNWGGGSSREGIDAEVTYKVADLYNYFMSLRVKLEKGRFELAEKMVTDFERDLEERLPRDC